VGGGRWESGERSEVQARSTLTSTAPKARSRSEEVATLDEVPRISTLDRGSMWSNPCESELTCFRPESNRGSYGLLNCLSAALSTTGLWWRMKHRKSFRTLFNIHVSCLRSHIPFVINDFSNLTNSLSPTPELQYTRDGTCEYVHSRRTCLKTIGSRKESIVLLYCKNTHFSRTQLHPWGHSRAGGQRCNEWNTADCMYSWCPVTTNNRLSSAGTRGTRLWATVTRWCVCHRVVDPVCRQGSLGCIEENPHRCSSTGTSWVCRFFFWRKIFVLPVLIMLY